MLDHYCIYDIKVPWNIKKKLRSLNPLNERKPITSYFTKLKTSKQALRKSDKRFTIQADQIPNAQQIPKTLGINKIHPHEIPFFEDWTVSCHILILPIHAQWIRTNTKRRYQAFLSMLLFGSQDYWHLHSS